MQHCAARTGIYPVIVDVIWRDIFTGIKGYLARISGGVCLAVISLRPLSAASAAPLARLRVAVKNSVASFVIFIGCSCYGRYVG